jgi:Uma2 family endonuclease
MKTKRSYPRRVRRNDVTALELEQMYIPNVRTELVRGRLVVREPAGARHGDVAMTIAYALKTHVDAAKLGRVWAAETGFKLFSSPDTVRAPDVAFVSRDRVPDPLPTGFADFAPDLAVEVLSPGDRPGEVLAKVADWLTAGTSLVWVVDPARRIARTYRADGTESILSAGESLSGEDVVPGFEATLASILQ